MSSPTGHETSTTTHTQKRAKIKVEQQVSWNEITSSSTSREKGPRVSRSTPNSVLCVDEYPDRARLDWKVGAHVSAAGGVENAILNAASIGANAFALFVKSQRKWMSPSLTEQSIATFRTRLVEFQYTPDLILPHGSYLINLGNPDEKKREKSYECFLDDLKRCEQLGLTRYNFHPGSTVGSATKDESIDHIACCLNRAHKETLTVMTVIENMAGSGNVLGSKFEEIAQIIDKVQDKSRVGVCLDTCHAFAAGYDIRSQEAYDATRQPPILLPRLTLIGILVYTVAEFDRTVGLHYLRGMHLNDSKTPLASHKDRHDNIGRGYISLAAFEYIMRDHPLRHIPLILETPTNEDTSVWKKEIEVLNQLSLRPHDENAVQPLIEEVDKTESHVSKGKEGKEKWTAPESKSRKRRRGEDHRLTNDEKDT